MYNHQLHYDGQLATFLVDAKMALSDMRGKVWDAICTLAESEGITFNTYLDLALQVLNLLLQIPIDILFHMQIPITIAYCPESSIYRKWCPKQGGILPLYKEIRVSRTLSKVLGGVTGQPSESVGRPPSPTPSDYSVGSGGTLALDPKLIAGHKVSLPHTADDWALQAQWLAVIPFIPKPPEMVRCRAASLIPPKARESVLRKRTTLRPRAMSRKHPRVKISRSTHTPRTPS